jgi:hypothetical protein
MGSRRNMVGSNQYALREAPELALPAAPLDLMAQADNRGQRQYQCGDIWGGKCQVPIGSPDWSHGNHPDIHAMINRASDPECLPEVLGWMSRTPHRALHFLVARNPACPSDVLLQMLDDPEPAVIHTAATNPSLSRESLANWQMEREQRVMVNA